MSSVIGAIGASQKEIKPGEAIKKRSDLELVADHYNGIAMAGGGDRVGVGEEKRSGARRATVRRAPTALPARRRRTSQDFEENRAGININDIELNRHGKTVNIYPSCSVFFESTDRYTFFIMASWILSTTSSSSLRSLTSQGSFSS